MTNVRLYGLVIGSLVLATGLFYLSNNKNVESVRAATAGHVVISEIKTGGSSTDEFVELYNPTDSVVSLEGWRLSRKISTGAESNLLTVMSGEIKPFGYYLISHPDSEDIYSADAVYSTGNQLTNNYTVLLYSDAGNTLVDKVGMGSAADYAENPAPNPGADESIERKARASSTSESMAVGGEDEFLGNGYNTGDNANDFVLRLVPQPQNSLSQPQIPPQNDSVVEGPIMLRAELTGDQEVPPVTTDASGEAQVVLYPDINVLTFVVIYEGLSSSEIAAHIHGPAPVGENAPNLYDLPGGDIKAGTFPYNPAHHDDFVAEMMYINIHSTNHPPGEIRGQLEVVEEVDPTPTPTMTLAPSPTDEPDPTATPTPTEDPDVTPTPTPTPVDDDPVDPVDPIEPDDQVVYQNMFVTCRREARVHTMFGRDIEIPVIICRMN